jgi:hypothetical protein
VARQREIEAGQVTRPKQRTPGQVVDAYLAHKANERKRSVDDDELILKRKILAAFGAKTTLRKITREDIARFTKARLEQGVRPGHKVKPGDRGQRAVRVAASIAVDPGVGLRGRRPEGCPWPS